MAFTKRPGFDREVDNRVTTDPPIDGQEYVRKDGEWAVATGGSGGATNLAYTASTRLLESSTGTDVTLPLVGSDAGLMSAADKTKLDGIAAGAEVNVNADWNAVSGDAQILNKPTISGTNTGDQTSIVGITGTKSQFDTAVTDGNFMYVGDAPTTHTHTIDDITDVTTAGQNMVLAANVAAQTALLDTFTTSLKGLAPSSGGGTTNFLRADGTWAAPPAGGSVALNDLTDVAITSPVAGQTITRVGSDFVNLTTVTFTLGPFYINDLPGTATTQATLDYFNTATAQNRNGNDIWMERAGVVLGLVVTSDAARTAGTATVRVRVAGAGTTFSGGAVVLDGTRTTSDSAFVTAGSGLAFTAGQTLGADVVTSGWTPTTANLRILLVVGLQY